MNIRCIAAAGSWRTFPSCFTTFSGTRPTWYNTTLHWPRPQTLEYHLLHHTAADFPDVMSLSSPFGLLNLGERESKWGHFPAACSHRLYRSQRDEWREWETEDFHGKVHPELTFARCSYSFHATNLVMSCVSQSVAQLTEVSALTVHLICSNSSQSQQWLVLFNHKSWCEPCMTEDGDDLTRKGHCRCRWNLDWVDEVHSQCCNLS